MRRRTSLYSLADWKYHRNRLGYDDLIDRKGRLVVTVNVMDLARDEMLSPTFVATGVPKRMFVLEDDNYWTIYLNVKWLTPRAVQRALDEFGRIKNRRFVFQPHRLPSILAGHYREAAVRRRQEVERERARGGLIPAHEFWKQFKKRGARRSTKPREKSPDPKRLMAVSTHKMKFQTEY